MADFDNAVSIMNEIQNQLEAFQMFGAEVVNIKLGWLDYDTLIAAVRASKTVADNGPCLIIKGLPVSLELRAHGVFVQAMNPNYKSDR